MNDAGSPIRSPSLRSLAFWHLLAVVADALVVGAAILNAEYLNLFGMRFPLLAMGAGLVVVSIAAAWLALGPFAISVRIVAAPLFGMGAVLLATIVLAASGGNSRAVTGVFLAGIVQFMGMQAPYWLLRTWNQLRIVHVRDLGAGGSMERLQYSLRQMLLAMTVVAVSLAIGRGVFALAGTAPANSNIAITLLAFFAILVCFNLLLAWPLLWALLAPTGVQWKIAASALLAGLVIVSALPLTTTVLGGEGPSIFWLVFVPQPAFLLTHLLAMRLAGYRLVRLT